MSNWSQKKMLLTIGGVALFVCATAGGGVYYAQGLIEETETKVKAKNGEIKAARQRIAKVASLEKEVVILRENLGEYVKILPDEKALNEFVRMLNKFEKQSGITGTGLVQKNARGKRAVGRFTPIEYTYDMNATLWQGLKFMNLIENYERFVSITDFSFTPGKSRRGAEVVDGEVVHQVRISMQTYQYNQPAAGKEVAVPNYEDRREELREEIWKRMQMIRLDHYEHKGQQGRRDILVDPRERGGLVSDPNKASTSEQKEMLEKYIGSIEKLEKMLETMRGEDTTLMQQYALEKRFKDELAELMIETENDGGMISYRPYRLRWSKEVMEPLARLGKELDGPRPGPDIVDPYLPAEEIRSLISMMADDCNNGQLEQAQQRYEELLDQLSVPRDDERHALAVEAKSWHVKAKTALDFKDLELRVQGVVVSGGGRSGVLLNGEVFEEGDYVADDLLVKQVEEEQVWFVYRGLTLVRTM
ncbi:MAG: type 4a pilus biogenesis protein PilO [Planctomycetota bacterium]